MGRVWGYFGKYLQHSLPKNILFRKITSLFLKSWTLWVICVWNETKQTICFCGKFLNFPAFSYDGSNPPGGSFILQKNSGFFWRFVKRVLVWLLLFSGLLLLGDVSEVLRFLSQVGRVLAGSGSLLVLVEEAKDSCCPAPCCMFSQDWCVFDINMCIFDVSDISK